MGRLDYQTHMEQRLRDLSFQIDCVKSHLAETPDWNYRAELAGQLARLEVRRDTVREKLQALGGEPDGTWDDLRAEIEDDWDALVQDFEERVASFA